MPFYKPGEAKPIKLGNFAPDADLDTPGILLDAIGAMPIMGGFRPMPSPVAIGQTIQSRPLGSTHAYYSDETTKLIVATATHIFFFDEGTLIFISPFSLSSPDTTVWEVTVTDGGTLQVTPNPMATPTLTLALKDPDGGLWPLTITNAGVLQVPVSPDPTWTGDTATRILIESSGGVAWQLQITNAGVLQVSATLTAAISGAIQFGQFGDDVIVVGAGTDPLVAANKSETFATLGGSPPSGATHIVVVGGQVLMFKGQDWYCSASGADNDWTPSLATLANTGTLYEYPGPIVGCSSIFRNALAFKKQAIWIGQQSGPPRSWNWHLISNQTGTWSQGCIINTPDSVKFLGIDDFYETRGYQPTRIPNNLAQWFFKTVNGVYIESTLGWYDALNSTCYWHFVSLNAPDPPTCDMFVSYNVRAQRWCVGYLAVSSVPYLNVAATQIPQPLSTRRPVLWDGDFRAVRLSGDRESMTLTTGYYGTPGRRSQLMRTKFIYDKYPTNEVVVPLHVKELGKADQQNGMAVLNNDGWHCTTQDDYYHKCVLETQGDCEVSAHAMELRPGGTS